MPATRLLRSRLGGFWLGLLALGLGSGQLRAVDYVIVVDTSGSMAGPISGDDRRPRLPTVKTALSDFLESLSDDSHVTLIPFNSGISRIEEFNFALPGERRKARTFVEGLRPGGETWLWTTVREALRRASAYHDASPQSSVMLWVLTDGNDTQGVTSFEKVLAEFPNVDGKSMIGSLVILGDIQLHISPAGRKLAEERDFKLLNTPDFAALVPLVIDWSPKPVRVGTPVTFVEKSGSKLRQYRWQIGGAAEYGQSRTVVFTKPGTERVRLVAAGGRGTEIVATADVEVLDQERVPLNPRIRASVAKAEPEQPILFEVATGAPATQVRWFRDEQVAGEGAAWQTSFARVGKYRIGCEVADARGVTERAAPVLVEIAEPDVMVKFHPVKSELEDGEEGQFLNECSSNLVRFAWDFGDGGASQDRDGRHAFRNSSRETKEFIVTLTAATATGRQFKFWLPVRVQPEKRPVATFAVVGVEFSTGVRIQFVNTSIGGQPNGDEWDFNGEQRSAEHSPEIVFATSGDKRIKLTVTGPTGLRESFERTIAVRQSQYPATVRWQDRLGQTTNQSPKELFFDDVPSELVRAASYNRLSYDRPEFSTFEIRLPAGLPAESCVEVSLISVSAANGFRLVDPSDPEMKSSTLLKMTMATDCRVEFDPKAGAGEYSARLIVRPVGPGVLLNGSTVPIEISLRGEISEGGAPFLLIAVIALVLIGAIAWIIWKNIGSSLPVLSGPVTLELTEIAGKGGASVRGTESFRLEPGDVVHFGRDEKTPFGAKVFDLGAPAHFLVHQSRSLMICERAGAGGRKSVAPGSIHKLAPARGAVRRVQVKYSLTNAAAPASVQKG